MIFPKVSWQILHNVDGIKDLPNYEAPNSLEVGADYHPLLARKIVKWMSRTDEPFLKLRSLLAEFSWKVQFNDERLDSFGNIDLPIRLSSDWAPVVSTISQWIPRQKLKARVLQIPGTKRRMADKFVLIFIQNLVALAACYGQSKHVALLDSGALAQVPVLV